MHHTTAVRQLLGLTEKRREIELLGLKDSADTDLRRCHSDIQLVAGMTKNRMSCRIWSFFWSFLRTPRGKLVLDTSYTSSKKRAQLGVNPLDHLSKAGRQAHDGVSMLFHSIGHGSLANAETDRPQSFGRAGKYKKKSCSVWQNRKCTWATRAVLMTWRRSWCNGGGAHDVWNLTLRWKCA